MRTPAQYFMKKLKKASRLKNGKTARVDNIPAELAQAGEESMFDVMTPFCTRYGKQANDLPHRISQL